MHPNKFSLFKSIEELKYKRQLYQERIDEINKQVKELYRYIEMQKDIEEHEA